MAKTKDENDELTAYYSKIYHAVETNTLDDPYGGYILKRVKGGQKTVFNKTLQELRNFDMSYLDVIESVYPAILKIMRDPKKSIRYEEEIVAVEKARKVNSQTVRHLSSHTHLIKEITKAGDVIPSKVLTTFAEEELAIYENRFIKSLVRRIEMFLERRYEVMKVSLESFATDRLNVTNEFLMSGQKVTVNLDIQVKSDLTTNIEATKAQYERLLNVREMIQGLKGTEFMRALAKAREVLPPIMKTNIIMHNPDFKLCYGLWLYLDSVDNISNDVDVREKSFKYGATFDKDINDVMALALTSFIKNRDIEGVYYNKNLPTVKAPKPEQNEDIQLELNLGADNKKLEDYTMNQLLLDETANFFEASMSGMERTGNTYNESVKVVYRQMLDMLDQIYPRAFGVADDELDSKSLYEQIEYARRRKMVINLVRQQKQMNILRMAKEEKRVEKLIEKLDKKIQSKEEQERLKREEEARQIEARRLEEEKKRQELEEKRRLLQEEAIATQKAMEKKIQSKHLSEETSKQDGGHTSIRARELAALRRDRLKELKFGEASEEQYEDAGEVEYVDEAGNPVEAPVEEAVETAAPTEEVAEEKAPEQVEESQEEPQPEETTEAEESQEDQVEAPAEEPQEQEETPQEEALDVAPVENTEEHQNEENEPVEEPQPEETTEAEESQEEPVQYVDENGNPVDENGNPIDGPVEYVDENGNPVDENGNPLDGEAPVEYVDENGNPVDADGNPLEAAPAEEHTEELPDAISEAADEYEQMLRDSGMTDEEIKALLGEK
ncbi:MAG: DUF2357 domain-containing protein [Bacilli bacterium]|nr:DUF2357 domain-containing protein [Bacilli bacterium]